MTRFSRLAALPMAFIVGSVLAVSLGGCPLPSYSYSASGSITAVDGRPIQGVSVTLAPVAVEARTDANGEWRAKDLTAACTATPKLTGWVFDPVSCSIQPTLGEVSGLDFNGYWRPIYPDTAKAPLLSFLWSSASPYGPLLFDLDAIDTCRPFGYKGTNSDGQSLRIYFATRRREPIQTPCDGTITRIVPWDAYRTAAEDGQGGEVWIRYGRNYAIRFRHLVTTGASIALGKTIKTGAVIGYTGDVGEKGSLLDLSLIEKDGSAWYYLNPYTSYDTQSRNSLVRVWQGASDKEDPGYVSTTTPWGSASALSAGDLAFAFPE